MITTDAFFAAFDRAGFLKAALWTPSAGLPGAGVQQSAQVRYTAPTQTVLAGDAFATDYAMRYPAGTFPGLKRGETVTVDGVAFRVREDPASDLDGTRLAVPLEKV
jgi:hypothetical protein